MHYSVASSDIKTRRNMITFRAINFVNPLPVGVKIIIFPLNGDTSQRLQRNLTLQTGVLS